MAWMPKWLRNWRSRRAQRKAARHAVGHKGPAFPQPLPIAPPNAGLPPDPGLGTSALAPNAEPTGPPVVLPSVPVTGDKLGDGGLGVVYEMVGQPHYVVKEFYNHVPNGAGLFPRYEQLREIFVGEPGIDAAWPLQPVVSGSTLRGFVMPRIPPQFYVTVAGRRVEAQIQYAIPKAGSVFLPDVLPTDTQRLEIVQRVAIFLDVLHRNDCVYGDVSWGNMLYSLNPTTLFVLDVDSIRPLGSMNMTGHDGGQTVDWNDPHSSGVESSFDGDRFKFALLLSRMLVTRDLSSPLAGSLEGTAVPGLSSEQHTMVADLLKRAGERAGGRPTMTEWRVALGVAAHGLIST